MSVKLVFNDTEHTVCGFPKPTLPNFKDDRPVMLEADICGLAPEHRSPCGNWLTLRATPQMVAALLDAGI